MNYKYIPKGVCSREMNFEIEDGVIKTLNVVGGCNGNLKGISSLLSGMKVDDAIKKLKGIECGYKNTSCPDQIAKALEKYLQESA
ncbi:MAG: TIGR03905 family TSCPD domain-containing protein [Erysipelotrichaceae bacterium]|nr:TIGR03905 family TSCPD domain-containing protein [Erysipelotrichaceae bacterium]